MKKSLLVSMMACMATVGVQAQGYTEVGSMDNVPVLIPGSYTADGKPLLFVKGGGDIHDGTFHFYDSDLKPVRDIELGLPEKGSYTMVKARSAQIVLLHSDEFALSWWDGDYSPSDEWPTREDWIERLTSFYQEQVLIVAYMWARRTHCGLFGISIMYGKTDQKRCTGIVPRMGIT